MPYLIALILCLVWPGALRAETRAVTLPLAVGARVQVAALSDGFTVGVFVRGTDAKTLGRRLGNLKPAHMQLLSPGPTQSVAYLRFATPVTQAVATQAHHHPGAGKVMAIRVEVTAETLASAVWAHAKSGRLPLPASLSADELRDADAQLVAGHVAQAQLILEHLKGGYALHAWVLLRLGDVALANQNTELACTTYAEASGEGLERTASMMALLRARVLGCPHAGAPPWDKLLSRDAIDDPVGQRMSDEAAWALNYETQVPALRDVLALQSKSYAHTIGRDLRERLLARLWRMETPLGLAALGESPSHLARHPEAFDLDLAVNATWCHLGSPESWRKQSAKASTWMTLSQSERKAWQARASTCALAVLPEVHVKAAAKSAAVDPAKMGPAAHLADLQKRLARAERTAFPPRPPPTPGPSDGADGGAVAEADGAAAATDASAAAGASSKE